MLCSSCSAPTRLPFTVTCNVSNMTYNTLAFTWRHAYNSCVSTGGRLLKPTSLDDRNCAGLLYDMHFSTSTTVRHIKLWVSLAPSLNTGDNTPSLCPKWQVNASSSQTQDLRCGIPAPYICVYGKKKTLLFARV